MSTNHTPGFDPEEATHEEWMVEIFGEKKGNEILQKQAKATAIMNEAKALVARRWREEFPDEDCSGKKKPWGSAWFNARPPY